MKGISALLRANAGRSIKAESAPDTVYLYDVIVDDDYWGGVSANTLIAQIQAVRGETLHLRINSPGGDVFAARCVEQALRECKPRVVVHIDGLAASAASFLAMAGDETVISPGGMLMIHRAWTLVCGNADDLMDMAAIMEKVDGTIAQTYAAKTGKDVGELMGLMAAETWLTAQEALEMGFVDSIAGSDPDRKTGTAENAAHWDLSAYEHAPLMAALARPRPRVDNIRQRYERTAHYFDITTWRN